ncbi:MAG: hypothetical protein J3R72DRAFT_180973 [Linnemannia gamsii]|nr:MAG: hypothetical protein J3R72DRAFT_180973 [Linnemannia gamsii]
MEKALDMMEHHGTNLQKTDWGPDDIEELRSLVENLLPDLGKGLEEFSRYLDEGISPEVNLELDKYSFQLTHLLDLSDDEVESHLDFDYFSQAYNVITHVITWGKQIPYPEILSPEECGYQPERIRLFELERSSSEDGNMLAGYGSGGTPELLRKYELFIKMTSNINQDEVLHCSLRDKSLPILEYFRKIKARGISVGKMAYCQTAKSIELSLKIASLLNDELGDWVSKIAVHGANSFERRSYLALFRLSREISLLLNIIVASRFEVPVTSALPLNIVTICAMLLECGLGFTRAGLCLALSPQELTEEFELANIGIAETCVDLLSGATRLFVRAAFWREFIMSRIKETNFCPSRTLFITLELHSTHMFHLIARSHHVATSRILHSDCENVCKRVAKVEDDLAGHLMGECNMSDCQTKYFKPIETTNLVLFDTENQVLVECTSELPYVAVSHTWFQGIFGQSSRKCGTCSLNFLRAACCKIGVRYAWIDTICMPSRKDLRPVVVGQLRDIYLLASATLVVDAGLICTKVTTTLDLSLAIWLSDWTSRVWTLQEGILASMLLFCVGNDVLAVPQVQCPVEMVDTRYMIPSISMDGYGLRKLGLGLSLSTLLSLAAGRQTSWSQDQMYGLSALLPSTKLTRAPNLEMVAMDVAKMTTRRIYWDSCKG